MASKSFLTDSNADIERIAQGLRRGGVFALPTETVYGLAGDAQNPEALEKIFKAKGRPHFDPLIIHIANIQQVEALAETNEVFYQLAQAFWPGPLTLILPKKACVPDLATANRPTVALRMPAHSIFRRILEASQLALAAPSANAFGYVSPTTAEHVYRCLGDTIDGILDGGPCPHGIESTILDISTPKHPTLYRPGPISQEALEATLGTAIDNHTASIQPPKEDSLGLQAPGLLSKHYSPQTPIELVDCGSLKNTPREEGTAHVHFRLSREMADMPHVYSLTQNGTLEEAAQNLYQHLRHLDTQNYTRILFEKAPDLGLGHAINNRLKRAAQH